MKNRFGENLALLLFTLLVIYFARAFNSSSPHSQVTIATQPAAFLNASCSQPGCGFDPCLAVERLNH